MAETEMQKAVQVNIESQAGAQQAPVKDPAKLLASFGGFNAIRGFLPDADNLNPARKAAKNVFYQFRIARLHIRRILIDHQRLVVINQGDFRTGLLIRSH